VHRISTNGATKVTPFE
jgi:hypothetical protein